MDNSIYKKCTECGQTKHISEFSKSYPNRCKTCVAEHTRQMRAAEKLKAKVKATGEVIDVEPSGTMQMKGSLIWARYCRNMNLEKLLPLRKVIWMLTDFIEKGKMQLT